MNDLIFHCKKATAKHFLIYKDIAKSLFLLIAYLASLKKINYLFPLTHSNHK